MYRVTSLEWTRHHRNRCLGQRADCDRSSSLQPFCGAIIGDVEVILETEKWGHKSLARCFATVDSATNLLQPDRFSASLAA